MNRPPPQGKQQIGAVSRYHLENGPPKRANRCGGWICIKSLNDETSAGFITTLIKAQGNVVYQEEVDHPVSFVERSRGPMERCSWPPWDLSNGTGYRRINYDRTWETRHRTLPDLGPPFASCVFTRDPPRPFASQLNTLHTTVAPKMLSVARHVARSSLSLRATARRPATLNMQSTGMGTNRFSIRTLISKFLLFRRSLRRRSGALDGGIYGTPLMISHTITAKKYTEDHEAVVFDDSTGLGTVSITDYAQSSLGDVVFVELPTLETKVTKGGQESPQFPCALTGV